MDASNIKTRRQVLDLTKPDAPRQGKQEKVLAELMDINRPARDPEEVRQEVIREYQLHGSGSEPEFNAVTELAAELFGVPISVVTVLGRDRQLFHGACGISDAGTARSDAFCNYTVERNDVFIVEDALADPRFRDNPLVTGEPHIRFYAGAPLQIGGGVAVGSLCLIDSRPRQLTDVERHRLALLARTVTDLMELRVGSRLAEDRQREIGREAEVLRVTIDHVQQGIGVFDKDLRLVLWNEQLMALLGIDPEICVEGYSAKELLLAIARRGAFGSGDPELIVDELIRAIRSTPSRRMELKEMDGRFLVAWWAAISDGRSILTFEDITEQRRISRMKDEFVSTVSHELRTPLTSIRGALAVLSRGTLGGLDDRSRQMLDMATKNAGRLTSLINDILDIEKLGSGTLAMQRERVDLGAVLREACEQISPFAHAHGVALNVCLPAIRLPVLGDAGRLMQAITNLLSNACKFSPPGSVVAVSGEEEGGKIKFTVKDNGRGIPPEFRPQMFRRFAQADPAHQKGTVGTGLGLAITRAIVERHGGEIGYESEVGQGTCFWASFPRLGDQEPEQ